MGNYLFSEMNIEEESDNCSYQVERLHNVPALASECCNLINLEWKRSHTARMRSIEGSSENYPMSLVLLRRNKKVQVVGHCKISRISMSDSRVFVETVVIHPNLRGKGLGTLLMNEMEKVCKSKNVKWIYLATKGQEGFYDKLGYTKCAPISIYGCQFDDSPEDNSETEEKMAVIKPIFNSTNKICSNSPPPPPLPQMTKTSTISITSTKTYMRKKLF